MRPLRLKLQISLLLLIVFSIGSGVYHYISDREVFTSWEKIQDLTQLKEKLGVALKQKPTEDSSTALQLLRAKEKDEILKEAISLFIQAHNTSSKSLLEKRHAEVEQVIFQKTNEQLSELQRLRTQMLFTRGVGYVLLAAGLMALLGYLIQGLLKPLERITANMNNFVEGEYQYKFYSPEPTEVGNLQATFNSIAQRVTTQVEELKNLDAAKSEFLSIASHELRTPLTSIKGSLGLLTMGAAGDLNPKAQSLLNIAESETDRLIRLINDLLDLTKIEAGRFTLKPDWYRIQKIVDKTSESLAGFANTAKVTLKIKPEPPVEIFGDSDLIQQILTNLLSNAIKFTPAGGVVSVTWKTSAGKPLRIEVKDQGPGISPNDKQVIFQKFRQTTKSNRNLVKGTGLGLAIAKAFVTEHKGTIGVDSELGEGSVFYFTLPEWREAIEPEDQVIVIKDETKASPWAS